MTLKFGAKEWFGFIIVILLLTDLAIILNIPFLRQILGFLFLTLLPGLLILQILKLNKIGNTEKFVLSVGLSIAFLMFFGLLINNLSPSLGYLTPLSTISLLISFNIAIITLAIIGYKLNKNTLFSLPDLNLTASEKAFLVVPLLFPALGIFGMHVMNTIDNNILLMLLLFLIPIYVAFVCIFNHKFPKRLYPVVIFSIGISLLLLMALRSNHLFGVDIHNEYYFFRTTLYNQHWGLWGHSSLDACLSISLLPTIYQTFLNVNEEYLFKILYSLIFSIFPLAIYVLSKKYIGEFCAFLTSCFSMFQVSFLWIEAYPRTSVAVLFFSLAMMTLFNDRIEPLKKKLLFIVFILSCIVSHYSTSYIFFFIMFGAFVGVELLSKKYSIKKWINLTLVVLFFAAIFFWYSQVTETAFNQGVFFIEDTVSNLNRFFVEESRSACVSTMFGVGIAQKGIPYKIEFVFTWLTFALLGIGVITLMIKHMGMSFPELKFKKPKFLKDKFEVEYLMIAIACLGLLIAMVALPYLTVGYDIMRLHAIVNTILSVCFVIGGIVLAKYLNMAFAAFRGKALTNLSLKKKALPKKLFLRKKSFTKRSHSLRNNEKNGSQVRAYLVILLVLIPYFFCVTDVTYQLFGVPRSIILNSEGEQYDTMYVHEEEGFCARWLKSNADEKTTIYTDYFGGHWLLSQGMIRSSIYDPSFIEDKEAIGDGYTFLRYVNVVGGKLLGSGGIWHNLTEYDHLFVERNKIYDNDGSQVWR